MHIRSRADILYSLNRKNLIKSATIVTITLFLVSLLTSVSISTVGANPVTLSLHTQDSQIVDANGNPVYLRGIGIAGFAPDLLLWGQGQSDSWAGQWNTNPTAVMDQTFSAMKEQWHINMIRVFIYPSWYQKDNIIPAQESSSYPSSKTPISTKTYLQTLCQEADKYGIYVDIVPYMLTPSASSFDKDQYASSGYGWQGLPMIEWDQPAQQCLTDAGYQNNELGFWRWFWTDIANTLKDYPNAIFEAWNEPNLGSDVDPIPNDYMTYLTTMYSAIRSTGAQNIIMMQWHMGWFPNGYGNTLAWCKQIADAIPNSQNIVYTTHLYYYAPSDLSSYWATDYAGLKTQLQNGINSMGITAPLVINEEGSCLTSSPNKQNDLTWWTNLIAAQRDLNLGAGAYYWLSDTGLGGVYSGESMLSSGYSPNNMGQAYINAYKPTTQTSTPTPTTTPTSTTTPTKTPSPTPKPTTIPTNTPLPTASATPKPIVTPTPTVPQTTLTPANTPMPTPTPTTPVSSAQQTEASLNPTTSPTAKASPSPTQTTQQTVPPSTIITPTQTLKPIFEYNYWYTLYFRWPPFNIWFFYLR